MEAGHSTSLDERGCGRLPIWLALGFCLLFQACTTVRVRELPLKVTAGGIESSRLLKSQVSQSDDELGTFADRSQELLRRAKMLELAGKSREAAGFYLSTALDSRMLLQSPKIEDPARDTLLEIHNHSLSRFAELWVADPARASGEPFRFSMEEEEFEVAVAKTSDYPALYFDRAVAAESLKGKGVEERRREGYGAAMVGIREQTEDRADELAFFSAKGLHVPISLVIEEPRITGKTTVVPISIKNPLLTESVVLGGERVPLAADYSGFMEMLLAGRNDLFWGLKGFFEADKRIENSGIYLLEPFDPDRIPVVLTHGLVSVPIIWRDLIPELMSEPEIAERYQFLVFTYPSSYILPESALLFREELAALREKYDPAGRTPLSTNMVAMGHSMGGMLTHLLIAEMGGLLWQEVSDVPLEQTNLSPEDKATALDLAFFDPDPAVRRAVYMSTPHGGASAADLNLANALSRLASLPGDVVQFTADLASLSGLQESSINYGKKMTSVQSLSPESPIVRAMSKAPYKNGVVYHSIIGDRGKGDTPDSSDGIVEYWSSHQPGAASEIIVPTGHSSYTHPNAVAEIKRILREHVGLR